MSIIYEKTNEDYHGGYCIQSLTPEHDNKYNYLGGNHKNIPSRFDKIVVPFGLFYRNRNIDFHNEAIQGLINEDKESECVEPELFDRLFYAVGRVELSKKDKYKHNNKTRKTK
jgi:hypothetical protein